MRFRLKLEILIAMNTPGRTSSICCTEERERKREERKEEERRKKKEEHEQQQQQAHSASSTAAAAAALASAAMHTADMYNSLAVEIDEDREMADVEDNEEEEEDPFSHDEVITESETEEEEEEEDEDYAFPIGPLPQMVTNDLKSLDEMVRELVSECQCPTQFPMIRVSEGKYRIGDTKVLIFVRILRNHVMVRVGGGWDTLQHYLDKHDPCRCRAGHKGSVGASYTMAKNGKNSLGGAICYDRSDSPGTPTRRSSTSNLAVVGGMGSRRNSNSTISPSPRPSIQDGYASPRGSTPHVFGTKSPGGNKFAVKTGLGRSESPSAVNYGKSAASSLTSNSTGGSGHGGGSVGSTATRSRSLIKSSGSDLSLGGGGKISRENSRQSIATSTSLQNKNLRTLIVINLFQVSRGSSSLFSERSNSSSSLGGHHSPRVGREGLSREATGGPLSNCDSSSEVSDEGYKSSHGGSKVGEGASISHIESNSQQSSQVDQNMTDRPESSLTVASECSSTISSSDSEHGANSVSPASESALASPEPSTNQILADDSEPWPEPPEPLQTAVPQSVTNPINSNGKMKVTPTGRGTWSARTSRERVGLTTDTYKSPYGGVRTASASPGPNRRQRKISTSSSNQDIPGNKSKGQSKPRETPLSTQSTPSKRPDGSARRSSREITAELETDDDAILKRMEEILMTYKSKVEDHLAAEGRELPSDIFEDFTTQWVNEASHLNHTIKGNKSRSSSSQRGYSPVNGSQDLIPTPEDHSRSSTPVIRTLPVWRKEYRDGQPETKIPVPTFYNSPIPSETNI
ncbi:hypothetical protein TCAL_16364 [Tigriopus californicus]|uniref:GAR domain-containing protein n=1 Tax=Tigriopus californicus TaxID=6832 RepID=A0A553NZ48_TIGCA|nr:hypothetical protein TCAL_16364 [Tigriopus californicus]